MSSTTMPPTMCTPTEHGSSSALSSSALSCPPPPPPPPPPPSPPSPPSPLSPLRPSSPHPPALRHTRQQQRRAQLRAAVKFIETLEARINGMRSNTKATAVIFEGLRESLTDTGMDVSTGERNEEGEETERGEVGAAVTVKRGVVVLRVSM